MIESVQRITGPEIPGEHKFFGGTAVMVPTRNFTKLLKLLKPTFEVVWDQVSSRWEIWDTDIAGVLYHVLTVETSDKTYKELSDEVLIKLQSKLSSRIGWDAQVNYWEELDRQIQEKRVKAIREYARAVAIETRGYWSGRLLVQVPRWYKKAAVKVDPPHEVTWETPTESRKKKIFRHLGG